MVSVPMVQAIFATKLVTFLVCGSEYFIKGLLERDVLETVLEGAETLEQ